MLFRFDPFEELDRAAAGQQQMLAMDAVRGEQEVTVYFDVPGAEPVDINVTAERNEITVEVERRWADDDKNTLIRERHQGSFRRQIHLGESLDTDAMDADLSNGVLTLRIPVSESAKARKIQISANEQHRQLEGSSS